jgi:hypothetical protein
MKALSLKQPYAELVVSGKKTIEVRKWNTHFRGEFLVHASKNVDKKAMEKFGFDKLPLGKIVGKATLKDVKHYANDKEHIADRDKHLASEVWGDYGFILEGCQRLNGKECNGKLGFWDFENNLFLF